MSLFHPQAATPTLFKHFSLCGSLSSYPDWGGLELLADSPAAGGGSTWIWPCSPLWRELSGSGGQSWTGLVQDLYSKPIVVWENREGTGFGNSEVSSQCWESSPNSTFNPAHQRTIKSRGMPPGKQPLKPRKGVPVCVWGGVGGEGGVCLHTL